MIVFSRIDEKLVHGQVATAWVRVAGANRIYIVDDVTAGDPFIANLFIKMAPEGTKVFVWSVEEAIEKLKRVEVHEKIKAMIITKTPLEFLTLVEAGVNIDFINVGNMSKKEGRRQLSPNNIAYASYVERNAFRALVNKGVDVYLQMIPDRKREPILSCPGMNDEEE